MKEPWLDWKAVGIALAIIAPVAVFVIYVRMTGHCQHTEQREIDVVVGKSGVRHTHYEVCADRRKP